jgi:cell division protein FtsL
MKKLYSIVLMLGVVALVLEIVNVNLSSKLASDSIKVKNLQQNIASLNEKNALLYSKVLDLTSFDSLASRAAELGFVPSNSYITLSNQVNLSYSK